MTTQELKQQIEKVLGNSIRCLLPSYWWRKLFEAVADRIDEVEQSTSELIEASKMPIVESENALKKLDVENGSIASVINKKTMKFSECYVPTDEDSNLTDEELFAKLTPVTGIDMNFPLPDISTADTAIKLVAEGGKGYGSLMIYEGFCGAFFALAGETQQYWTLFSQTMVDELNEYLSQQRWYFFDKPEEVGAENMALFDQIFTIVDVQTDVYVKGAYWERIAKESDLERTEGDDVKVDITIDSELSETSENAAQNKVITTALNTKVDKIEGKQLSTEDFTTALKTKLEGLNAFDPTEINNKVDGLQTQLDTLVSGDASTAIESFNEITAFLNGVTDSETLDGIIASIEQQIANKQDKIEDLETIRSGAALGATALQEHQDISHLATKVELNTAVDTITNTIIENEEVSAAAFNEINDRINAISENVSGTTVTKEEFEGAVTTINESIATKADATSTSESISSLEESVNEINTSLANYATTESLANEVEAINNAILENEEITAAALNELNERVVTPYEYYKEKGGVVSESAYNIMTKYLFTPFIISNNSTTTIPDELLNESKTAFFTDYYWNFMRLTGGEPIRTTQWANNIPQKFVGISSGLSFVIDFSNKTITPEQ